MSLSPVHVTAPNFFFFTAREGFTANGERPAGTPSNLDHSDQ